MIYQPDNINKAKKFTEEFSEHISFYVDDSLSFLQHFNKSIDLLYLDELIRWSQPKAFVASKHQLNEAKIAVNKLKSKIH